MQCVHNGATLEIDMKILATATLIAFGFAAPAFAGTCPDHPKAEWLTKSDFTAKAVAAGYDVKNVKTEDGCWEVKGFKDGKRVEAYFDTKTAELIASK
jgi:hypothetical protein